MILNVKWEEDRCVAWPERYDINKGEEDREGTESMKKKKTKQKKEEEREQVRRMNEKKERRGSNH